MRYLICLLTLLGLPLLAADVWKWRDAQGVIHYSDQPVPGAERVITQASNTFTPAAAAVPSSAAQSSAPAAAFSYSNVEIWKPSNEATLMNTSTVDVAARIEPGIAPGHQVALYFDGKLVEGSSPQATSFTLNEVSRGEHSLTLVIADAQGKRVTSSSSVTFYVQQPSILRKP